MRPPHRLSSPWLTFLLLLPCLLGWRAAAAAENPALLALAAAQPGLAEQVAKNYLFLGTDSFAINAENELREGMRVLNENHARIKAGVQNPEALQLLGVVENAVQGMGALVAQRFTPDGGMQMIDFSDAVSAEGTNIARLLAGGTIPLPALVQAQRTFNERIAKLYLAQQLLPGGEFGKRLGDTIAGFDANLGELRKALQGGTTTLVEVEKIERLSRSMRRLISDDRGARMARVVLISCTNIGRSINDIERTLASGGR